MKPIEAGDFLDIMENCCYEIFEDGKLNIIGYRHIFGRPNYYDDVLSVYRSTGYGWITRHYPCTTRPGTPYLLKPVNPHGAAILVPGQYKDAYTLGMHRGKYKALIQVSDLKVFRDNNLDEDSDEVASTIEIGMFGINIHRASLNNLVVGPDSAGCQVIRSRSGYNDFIGLCEASRQEKFTYTLIEI